MYVETMAPQLHSGLRRRRCLELGPPELSAEEVDRLLSTLGRDRKHFSTRDEAHSTLYAWLFMLRLAMLCRTTATARRAPRRGRPNETALRDLVLSTIAESVPNDPRHVHGWRLAWDFGVHYFQLSAVRSSPSSVRHEVKRRRRSGLVRKTPALALFLKALERHQLQVSRAQA